MVLCFNNPFCNKWMIVIANLILLSFTAILIATGAWLVMSTFLMSDYGVLSLDFNVSMALLLLGCCSLAVLCAIIILSFAFKEQNCAFFYYATVMCIIVTALCCATAFSYIQAVTIERDLPPIMTSALHNYNSDSDVHNSVSRVQARYECCGGNNYTDWLATPWYKAETNKRAYPASCCSQFICLYSPDASNDTRLYHKGCNEELTKEFKYNFILIGSVAAVATFIVSIAHLISCVVIERRHPRSGYIAIGQTAE